MIKTLFLLSGIFLLSVFSLSAQNENLNEHQKKCIVAQKLANKALKLVEYTKDDSLRKTYYKKAITTIDSALTIRPNYQIALKNKFKYQYLLKDYKELLKTIDRLIEVRPDLAVFIMHKAKIYELMGKAKKAKKMFQLALETFENRVKTLNPLAIYWIENVEYAQTLHFSGATEKATAHYNATRLKYKDEPYLKLNKTLQIDYTTVMKHWSFTTDGSEYHKSWHKK